MDWRYLMLTCASAAMLCGCRTVDPARYVLYQELRALEDNKYQLQDLVTQLRAQLDSCRRNSAATSDSPQTAPPSQPAAPPSGELPALGAPGKIPPASELNPPKIDLGTETSPPSDDPPGNKKPRDKTPSGDPPAEKSDSKRAARIPSSAADKLLINPLLTGGHNTSSRPGDEGLLVVMQPQDATGRTVEVAGELEIRLADPQRPGTRPIALWRFSPNETAAHYRKTIVGRALQFDLPWPGEAPTASKLRLSITLQTPDGRRLAAVKDIRVAPAGLPSRRWSKAPPRKKPESGDTGGPIIPHGSAGPELQEPTPSVRRTSNPPASSSKPPLRQKPRPSWSPNREP